MVRLRKSKMYDSYVDPYPAMHLPEISRKANGKIVDAAAATSECLLSHTCLSSLRPLLHFAFFPFLLWLEDTVLHDPLGGKKVHRQLHNGLCDKTPLHCASSPDQQTPSSRILSPRTAVFARLRPMQPRGQLISDVPTWRQRLFLSRPPSSLGQPSENGDFDLR